MTDIANVEQCASSGLVRTKQKLRIRELHNSKFKNLVDNSAELPEAASRKLLSDQCFCICTRNQGKRRHVSAWKFEIPLRKRNVPTRYSGINHKTRQECAVLHGEKSG